MTPRRVYLAAVGGLVALAAAVIAVPPATAQEPASATAHAPVSALQPQRTPLGWAIPIVTPGPAWFDAHLYQRVVAAGARGVPLRDVNTRPQAKPSGTKPSGTKAAGSGSCLSSSGQAPSSATVPTTPNGVEREPVGLGPGTFLLSVFCSGVGGQQAPTGFAWCTANFVFQNGSSYGLGTAGHCAAKDALGSPVTALVVPPPEVCANGGSCAPGLYAIGTFSIVHNGGLGDDFALISLYPAFNSWVRPTMPVFGGPTGAYGGGLAGLSSRTTQVSNITANTPAYSPAAVGHCGWGVAVGSGTCRTSAGLFSAGTWYAWYGASAPGDSGSAVEILGNYAAPANAVPAVADLTHIIISDITISNRGAISAGADEPGMVAGTQISKILGMVGSWRLVTGGLP